jgi:hypothetical protein
MRIRVVSCAAGRRPPVFSRSWSTALCAASVSLSLSGHAVATSFNWDIKYVSGSRPAGQLDIVLKGNTLTAASTFNGGTWWPNGSGASAPAPLFQQFSSHNTTINTILQTVLTTPVVDLRWTFPNSLLTVGNGVHVGAAITGTAASSANTAGIATLFYSDANGVRIVGSAGRIVQLGASYTAPARSAVGAAQLTAELPSTVVPGQTVSAVLPVSVPEGRRLVLFHESTDDSGNFTASTFTEFDAPPAGGASSITITATNDLITDDGSPAPSVSLNRVEYAITTPVALADLNTGNASLMNQMVAVPLTLAARPPIRKTAKFACTGTLTAPTNFTAWCVPRGSGCAVVPNANTTTAVYPANTTCAVAPAGFNQSIVQQLASGLNSVCDSYLNSPSRRISCVGSGNAVTCAGTTFGDEQQFDVCINNVDVVDTLIGDADLVTLNGMTFSGAGKTKVPVPVLGGWGIGACAAALVGASAVLARRKRARTPK